MSHNNIKISVIVPVYNSEKYLERCLNSITKQSLKEIEIICINDGSTDKSCDIIKNFLAVDSRIKLVNQENQGLSVARNNGIKNAVGEYISFIDSDDFIDINFYEVLYTAAKRYNADISCSGIIKEDAKKKKIILSFDNEVFEEDIRKKFLISKSLQHCFVWNKIYKRDSLLLNNLFFPSGIIYEDMMFTPDVLEKLNGLVVTSGIFYHYWKHPGSIIRSDSDKFRADKLFVYSYFLKIIRKYNLDYNEKWKLIKKQEYIFCGIKILKIYEYRATKKYYLFGLIPFLVVKDRV